jgi:hypothetical protein
MCKEASFIVLRDSVPWSRTSDRHEDIICEHRIHMDGVGGPNGVRVEISPSGDTNFDEDPASWIFCVDQDILPSWWDKEDAERRTRLALNEWIAAKLVRKGEIRDVGPKDYVVAVLEGGTIGNVWGGTIQSVDGGTIRNVRGGTIRNVRGGTIWSVDGGIIQSVDGGIIQSVYSGTIWNVCGGTIQSVDGGIIQSVDGGMVCVIREGMVRFYAAAAFYLEGPRAVAVDNRNNRSKCYVGSIRKRKVVLS